LQVGLCAIEPPLAPISINSTVAIWIGNPGTQSASRAPPEAVGDQRLAIVDQRQLNGRAAMSKARARSGRHCSQTIFQTRAAGRSPKARGASVAWSSPPLEHEERRWDAFGTQRLQAFEMISAARMGVVHRRAGARYSRISGAMSDDTRSRGSGSSAP
jgi:hypothetical protein